MTRLRRCLIALRSWESSFGFMAASGTLIFTTVKGLEAGGTGPLLGDVSRLVLFFTPTRACLSGARFEVAARVELGRVLVVCRFLRALRTAVGGAFLTGCFASVVTFGFVGAGCVSAIEWAHVSPLRGLFWGLGSFQPRPAPPRHLHRFFRLAYGSP